MTAESIQKILLFLFVNALGFSSSTITFVIGLKLGRLSAENEGAISLIQEKLFLGSSITWIVCALFSVCYFFFDGRWGKAFLWSAFVIPFAYGLSVVLTAG